MKEFRIAAAKNNVNKLRILLNITDKRDEIINSRGLKSGKTALHFAAERGAFNAVKFLVETAGVDINLLDNNSHSPLYLTVNNLHVEIAKYLLEKKAKTLTSTSQDKHLFLTPLEPITLSKRKFLPGDKSVKRAFLIKLLKKYIVEEASNMVNEFAGNINGLELLPNGYFKFKQTEIESLMKNYKKYNKISMRKHGMHQFTLSTKEKGIVRNVSKVFGNMQKNIYNLPPLIFFMSHDAENVFNIVTSNLEKLEAYGYRCINFEFDQDMNLDSTILELKNGQNDICEITAKFLSKVKKEVEAKLLEYSGIDCNFGKLRRSKFLESFAGSDSMVEYRDELLASNIMKSNEKYKGATISFVGIGHIGILEHIKRNDCQFPSYLCFSSMTSKQKNKQVNDEHLKMIYPCYISNKNSLQNSSKQFMKEFELHLSKNIFSNNKLNIRNEDTCISKKLKNILRKIKILPQNCDQNNVEDQNKDCSASCMQLRYDNNFNLDAFIKVKNEGLLDVIKETIKSNIKLELPLKTVLEGEENLYVVIPAINSINAKSINDASSELVDLKKSPSLI